MSAIGDCCNPCPPFTPPVNIPGSPGESGIPGSNGVNAFSTITGQGFVVPGVGNSQTIFISDTGEWMAVGQPVYVSGAGQYQVSSAASVGSGGTSVQLRNLGAAGNAVPGSVISPFNTISPSGLQGNNSYTFLTSPITTLPYQTGAGSPTTVTISVQNAAWAIVGQIIFIQAAGYYNVVSVNTALNQIIISNPGFANTLSGPVGGGGIPTGNGVGPSGTQGSLALPSPVSMSANGQAAAFLSTSATPINGTDPCTVTLPAAGTWLLICRMNATATGSPAGTNATITAQLEASYNGGAYGLIAGSVGTAQVGTYGNNTLYGVNMALPAVIYTTQGTYNGVYAGDIIQLYAAISNTSNFSALTANSYSLTAACLSLTV